MKLANLTVLILIFSFTKMMAQEKTEQDIDFAFQNAKKGIYWALSNIPGKKTTLDNELIAEDKLYATVKLNKEINGVKVISRGYYQTNQVEIIIYKSYESLKSEGYEVPNTGWE